jgi:hypothetical protein
LKQILRFSSHYRQHRWYLHNLLRLNFESTTNLLRIQFTSNPLLSFSQLYCMNSPLKPPQIAFLLIQASLLHLQTLLLLETLFFFPSNFLSILSPQKLISICHFSLKLPPSPSLHLNYITTSRNPPEQTQNNRTTC